HHLDEPVVAEPRAERVEPELVQDRLLAEARLAGTRAVRLEREEEERASARGPAPRTREDIRVVEAPLAHARPAEDLGEAALEACAVHPLRGRAPPEEQELARRHREDAARAEDAGHQRRAAAIDPADVDGRRPRPHSGNSIGAAGGPVRVLLVAAASGASSASACARTSPSPSSRRSG